MLRTVPNARYTELNTLFVESGHFQYHLQQLIKDGLIEQVARGQYALSQKGLHFTDTLSLTQHSATPMPKVITYTLLKSGKNIVLQQKQKQPYLGLYNMIGGKVHEGETTQEAAVREIQEKTGIHITPRHTGVFEVIIRQSGNILTHAIAYTYEAEITAEQCEFAHSFVVQHANIAHTKNLAPDTLPILMHTHNTSVPITKTLLLDYLS